MWLVGANDRILDCSILNINPQITQITRIIIKLIIFQPLNPDKPEITNYKHQITNNFQMTTSKSQIRSKTNCLEIWISVIVICLVFVFCYLKFLIAEAWHHIP